LPRALLVFRFSRGFNALPGLCPPLSGLYAGLIQLHFHAIDSERTDMSSAIDATGQHDRFYPGRKNAKAAPRYYTVPENALLAVRRIKRRPVDLRFVVNFAMRPP
tara:strand:- start:239 stop:553 length:315 start_codon:yes stop_codon:yes gene_type:complete